MKTLRDYQLKISKRGAKILNENEIVYLTMEVRTGKTATALNICKLNGYKSVIFLTKKRAISSILKDYSDFNFDFNITVINDESMHHVSGVFDCVVHDEHHRFGSYPKPSQGAKLFKKMFSNLPMIFLSGTPSPESYSQLFHQFWVSKHSPFPHKTFYKWAQEFVTVKDRHLGYAVVKDYSDADRNKIMPFIDHLMISYTQKESGFTSTINEIVLYSPIKPRTISLIKQLQKDLVIEGKTETILADTAVKLMQKTHQLYSGTVKFESGNSMVVDTSKAEFIKEYFKGQKIAIFYKFKAELDAIISIFGNQMTTDLTEFDNTSKSIALQIIAGREGISLKNAQSLIFYNIDFSATSYFQAKDRLTTMDRPNNDVYWVFTKFGIEEKIYKSVMNKLDYTLSHFKTDHGIKVSNKSYSRI